MFDFYLGLPHTVCMNICMYVCMYVCMYIHMDGWMDGWICVCTYVCEPYIWQHYTMKWKLGYVFTFHSLSTSLTCTLAVPVFTPATNTVSPWRPCERETWCLATSFPGSVATGKLVGYVNRELVDLPVSPAVQWWDQWHTRIPQKERNWELPPAPAAGGWPLRQLGGSTQIHGHEQCWTYCLGNNDNTQDHFWSVHTM